MTVHPHLFIYLKKKGINIMDLEKAIEIAIEAHRGQVDQAGAKYIYHPLRVMSKMQDNDRRIVAILHDVIEDTDVTIEDLRIHGFNEEVLDSILVLTKLKWMNYFEYIQNIIEYDKMHRKNRGINSIALDVKLADLRDNMDFTRLHEILRNDIKRNEKYAKARRMFYVYMIEGGIYIHG
jgi:(p)ppGpp synthase/HD superfamily hydrolase